MAQYTLRSSALASVTNMCIYSRDMRRNSALRPSSSYGSIESSRTYLEVQTRTAECPETVSTFTKRSRSESVSSDETPCEPLPKRQCLAVDVGFIWQQLDRRDNIRPLQLDHLPSLDPIDDQHWLSFLSLAQGTPRKDVPSRAWVLMCQILKRAGISAGELKRTGAIPALWAVVLTGCVGVI